MGRYNAPSAGSENANTSRSVPAVLASPVRDSISVSLGERRHSPQQNRAAQGTVLEPAVLFSSRGYLFRDLAFLGISGPEDDRPAG